MLALLVCDLIGGFVALGSGADTWNEAWGFETQHTVPLPVGVAQLVLAWLAARNPRPPVGFIAAVLLSGFCLISLLAGLFDGDLIKNVASDGLLSLGVAWGVVLLALTAAVGLLAALRAKELRQRR
jgi:peptidoglycan/LPS O-acetylase OafA/YrhL